MSTITLRPYQEEALQKIDEAAERGVRRQLGVAATGLGKTIMFASLAERTAAPTLILAHRDELITQAADKVKSVWPDADIGVVKAERNEIDHQVVVASVQTLARGHRREQLPLGHFQLVVVDEAHHAKAVSYQNILEYLRAGKEDGPLLVGVTATPGRGDGKGLDDVFDEIVFNYDMLWGIRSGYLSDLRGMRVYLEDVDFSKARVRQGDYDAGETGQMMEDADAPSLIARSWLEHAEGRQTIVFTPTVAVAEKVAEELTNLGVRAAMVSGKTPLEERREILRRYGSGDIQVVANCAVLTEGFDEPATSCIVMARPTKSQGLYVQSVGRGTRRHPDKVDCLVIDVVGASSMSLVTVPSLFGISDEKDFEAAEKTVTEAVAEQEEQLRLKGELKAREVDLFKQVLESPIAWVHFDTAQGAAYTMQLGKRDRGEVAIEPLRPTPQESEESPSVHYACFIRWDKDYPPLDEPTARKLPNGEYQRTLITGVDLEMAQGVGEDYVRKNAPKAFSDKKARWRNDPPSEAQLGAAAKWRMPVNPDWSKGELSEALSAHIAAKKAQSRNRSN